MARLELRVSVPSVVEPEVRVFLLAWLAGHAARHAWEPFDAVGLSGEGAVNGFPEGDLSEEDVERLSAEYAAYTR